MVQNKVKKNMVYKSTQGGGGGGEGVQVGPRSMSRWMYRFVCLKGGVMGGLETCRGGP